MKSETSNDGTSPGAIGTGRKRPAERPADQADPNGGLEQRLRDERRGQRGPARAGRAPANEVELREITAASRNDAVEPAPGQVRERDVTRPQLRRLRIGGADDREPAARADHLLQHVQQDPGDKPPRGDGDHILDHQLDRMASAPHRGLEPFDHAVEGMRKSLTSPALRRECAIDGDRDKNGRHLRGWTARA
jgi:hypothetical protein